MAHFAKVLDGIVTDIMVAEQDFMDQFVDTTPGDWIQTSYNMRGGVYYDPETNQPADDQSVITGNAARERKNYAVIGGHYDANLDIFYPEKPFDSWLLNEDTGLWEAPIDKPDLDFNEAYQTWWWDEDAYQADNTTGWVVHTNEFDKAQYDAENS